MSKFPAYGPSIVSFMDIPLISGDEEYPWAPRVACYQHPWPGQVVFTKLEADQFMPFDAVIARAAMGETITPMSKGSPWIIDRKTKFSLVFYGEDKLQSISEEQMLRGGNILCVENKDGSWEVLQFAEAELIGPKQYELSVLLRGQNGTEQAAQEREPGARVVLYEEQRVEVLNLPRDLAQLPLTMRYGAHGYNPTHYTFQQEDRQFKAIGLRPYSPCQLRRTKSGGETTVSWIRRTRFQGDAWEAPEVPLNEDKELYEAEVRFANGLVISSGPLTESGFSFWADQEFEITVWQVSPTYGKGEPTTEKFT